MLAGGGRFATPRWPEILVCLAEVWEAGAVVVRRIFQLISVILCLGAACGKEAVPAPGRESQFHGFTCREFKLEEVSYKVVSPKEALAGKPWIWRARFFGHEPQLDKALLERGVHVVYCDVANLFGSPVAVARWNKLYNFLVGQEGFHKKPVLEGMSRGGLIVYNWAKENPEKVSCIYADAPVCDIKSWPRKDAKVWAQCLKAYGFRTDAEGDAFKGNPIDGLEPLAKANVPLLHVVGDADKVVPVAENTAVLEKRYKSLGGEIAVIHKPDVGHHPHSLKDPQRLVDFVMGSLDGVGE